MYDLGIIGAGPAGYTAALHAASKGEKVVVFEKDEVGGTCLNCGCIPTKAILHSAKVYEEMKCAENLGLTAENLSFDFAKIIKRKNSIVENLRKGLELSLKNSKVEVIKAFAEKVSETEIRAGGKIFECRKILIATGSKPRSFKGMEFDGEFILSSDDVLNLKSLPKNILIIGSGAIGIEWSRIFSAFDVEVTVVELADNLLPAADFEVSKRIERIFKSKKIKFYKSSAVIKIENKKVYLSNGDILEPELVLLAAGREVCRIDNCGESVCIGDACGQIQLAHFASKQAIEYVEGIPFDKTLVPSVVYGNPEIAWAGKREQDLKEGSYTKSNLLISALGKSQCDSATEGFIKILSRNDEILGVHIISQEASAMVQQIIIAIQNNISVSKLKEICFAHPTYSEGIFESLFRL